MLMRSMSMGRLALGVLLMTAIAAPDTHAFFGQRGLYNFEQSKVSATPPEDGEGPAHGDTPATPGIPKSGKNENSPLTLGNMLGVTYALANPKSYKVRNGVVVDDRSGTGADRFQPGVFAFPSIGLVTGAGYAFSAIVPAGVTGSGDAAAGVGFAFSSALGAGAQVGL